MPAGVGLAVTGSVRTFASKTLVEAVRSATSELGSAAGELGSATGELGSAAGELGSAAPSATPIKPARERPAQPPPVPASAADTEAE